MSESVKEQSRNIIALTDQEIEEIAERMIEQGLFPVWHPAPPPKRKSSDSITIN